jgi:hypothetical protein
VPGGHYGLRRLAYSRGHVAVMVHQRAVHVQGDHELLVDSGELDVVQVVVLVVLSPVIVAGD